MKEFGWKAGGLLIATMTLAGCARVAFYSVDTDANGKQPNVSKFTEETETGVKYYNPKPYLLVARTGAKDKPVEISVIYLPDLAHPNYAKGWTGLGTTNLQLSLTNGVITSVGQQVDSKIPEFITSLASLGTAIGGLVPKPAGAVAVTASPQQIQILKSDADDLRSVLNDPKERASLTTEHQNNVADAAKQLDAAVTAFSKNPQDMVTGLASLDAAVDDLRWAPGMVPPPPTRILQVIDSVQNIRNQLSAAKTPALPSFELYEISTDRRGNTVLKPVQGVPH
jgi:hypothetical protein